jgi:hypothetical protein
MEFSNDEEGEQLNIWLKASDIHDVLKCLADDDPDTLPLFNGFEDVIRNAHLGELCVKPYGENVCRANKKNGYTYKDFVDGGGGLLGPAEFFGGGPSSNT